MRAADVTTAGILLLIGVVVLADALRLGIGWGTDGPKSGFFPFWLAIVMMLACAVTVGRALRRSPRGPFVTGPQLGPVLRVLVPAAGMVFVTEFLGLYVAAGLYIAVYMRWIGHHRWPEVAAFGLGVPLVTFLVFERWFLVPMPKGPFEAWLGF